MKPASTHLISRNGSGGALFLKVLGDGSLLLVRKGAAGRGDDTIALTAGDMRLIAQVACE